MKRTLIALFLIAVGTLAWGCGLCPIPGFGNLSSIQTTFFKLEKALRGSTWTHVSDYIVRQDVTYPAGQWFTQVGYSEESPKRKKTQVCVEVSHVRGQDVIKRTELCEIIKKNKPASFYMNYPAGYNLRANDLVEMWVYSKKTQPRGTAFQVEMGYSVSDEAR